MILSEAFSSHRVQQAAFERRVQSFINTWPEFASRWACLHIPSPTYEAGAIVFYPDTQNNVTREEFAQVFPHYEESPDDAGNVDWSYTLDSGLVVRLYHAGKKPVKTEDPRLRNPEDMADVY